MKHFFVKYPLHLLNHGDVVYCPDHHCLLRTIRKPNKFHAEILFEVLDTDWHYDEIYPSGTIFHTDNTQHHALPYICRFSTYKKFFLSVRRLYNPSSSALCNFLRNFAFERSCEK